NALTARERTNRPVEEVFSFSSRASSAAYAFVIRSLCASIFSLLHSRGMEELNTESSENTPARWALRNLRVRSLFLREDTALPVAATSVFAAAVIGSVLVRLPSGL